MPRRKEKEPMDLYVTPSTLEVDFDKNVTKLYRYITEQKWDKAVAVCKRDPVQAATWVVRHYEDDDEDDDEEGPEIMWRFLPLHSACARQPPAAVVQALIRAYPDGPKCIDDQGMYALHYACGNQAARDVIRQLLVCFPEAAKMTDPRGMLPIHYLACWGPSSVSVVDMLLVAHSDVADIMDDDGNTPLDLAMEADYTEKEYVVSALKKWFKIGSSRRGSKSRVIDVTSVNEEEEKKEEEETKKEEKLKKEEEEIKEDKEQEKEKEMTSSEDTKEEKLEEETKKEVHEEEKKEEEEEEEKMSPMVVAARAAATYASTSKLRPFISPDEVKRLQEEIRSLKSRSESNQRVWEKKMTSLNEEWKKEYEGLKKKSEQQEDEIAVTKAELQEVQKELEQKVVSLKEEEKELEKTKKALEETKTDLSGLRSTLGDLMEQHESFKKKNSHMNDRLGSLAASLVSMMEQQDLLMKAMKDRNETRKMTFQKRKDRLTELIEMEQELDSNEDNLDEALKKQNREMEAIAAVIAAARQ